MSDGVTWYRRRWDRIQAGFVDGPAGAVEQADALVRELLETDADPVAAERAELEQRWDRTDVTTEELRATLVHYRSLFDRLLERSASSVAGVDVDEADEVLAGEEAADVLLHP